MPSDIADHPTGEHSKNLFVKKLGPLPGWAWILIGVGVVYAGSKVVRRGSAPVADSSTTDGSTPNQLRQLQYSPAATGYGGQNDNGMLASFLSILAAQPAGPTPGNPATPAPVAAPTPSPGNTGSPAWQNLPQVRSGDFGQFLAPGQQIHVIGNQGAGGYTGYDVGGGVPVYALIRGTWQQNWNPADIKAGVQLGIPQGFEGYIRPELVTNRR